MKTSNKIAIAVALSLGLTAAAYAQQGQFGNCTGPNAEQGCQQQMQGRMGQGRMQGMQGNMGQGRMQGMQGNMGQGRMQAMNYGGNRGTGPQAGRQLMTPEERTAMQEKMRATTTPEERQQLMAANHAEMQKRAAEKGITLPEQRGPYGRGAGPATTEQAR